MTASPGWIKFARSPLTCEKDYGDGDSATLTESRTLMVFPFQTSGPSPAGTLIVEEKSQKPCIRHHGTSLVEVHHRGFDFRGLVDPEVSSVSDGRRRRRLRQLGWIFSSKDHLSINERRSTDRDETGGSPYRAPPFLFSPIQPSRLPDFPR